jgi:hypothetical protein
MTGKPRSPETRAKISASLKGRAPWSTGKFLSPETCAKISAKMQGRVPWNKGMRGTLSKADENAILRWAMQ